jgi:hypothetical protein
MVSDPAGSGATELSTTSPPDESQIISSKGKALSPASLNKFAQRDTELIP